MPDIEGRSTYEGRAAQAFQTAFRKMRNAMYQELWREGMIGRDIVNVPAGLWQTFRNDMLQLVEPELIRAFLAAAGNMADKLEFGLDYDDLERRAEDWAQQHTERLYTRLKASTERMLQRMAARLDRLQLTKKALRELLDKLFNLNRVNVNAITQVTNAVSAGEKVVQDALSAAGANVDRVWFTQLDERVCPICAPRHGKIQGNGWQTDPPAHPRCRCYIGYRIDNNGQRVILFDDEAVARRLRRS